MITLTRRRWKLFLLPALHFQRQFLWFTDAFFAPGCLLLLFYFHSLLAPNELLQTHHLCNIKTTSDASASQKCIQAPLSLAAENYTSHWPYAQFPHCTIWSHRSWLAPENLSSSKRYRALWLFYVYCMWEENEFARLNTHQVQLYIININTANNGVQFIVCVYFRSRQYGTRNI